LCRPVDAALRDQPSGRQYRNRQRRRARAAARVNRFDSLVHVTRDGRWLNGRADAGAARLASELDRGRIDRACLVGLPGVVDNAYILECARADARLVPIAGVTPGDFDAAALARAGFAGIKLHPRLGGYDPLADSTLAAVK